MKPECFGKKRKFTRLLALKMRIGLGHVQCFVMFATISQTDAYKLNYPIRFFYLNPLKLESRYGLILVIFLPWLQSFTIGRPFSGIFCLILQLTLIGWIPAAIWSTYALSQHTTVTNALLHLLSQVAMTSRHVPIAKRNEILIKYLKPKVNIKALANIKKDIKLMLSIARKNGANLERRLFELQEKANQSTLVGAERLYSLLVYLYDEAGFESRLFEEGSEAKEGIIYMLEEHIEHGFNDKTQVAPLSMLVQSEKAPSLIDTINQHSWFEATMHEWNAQTYQAHIQIHPAKTAQHVSVHSD